MPTTRSAAKSADMEAALKLFFSSPRFAVAGASSDPTKFGHKVFSWYLQHSLPVAPLNPRAPTISVLSKDHTTYASPRALPSDPSSYSLSIITPPAVTKPLLEEAKSVGIKAVWLQPGTYNDDVRAYAEKEFEAAILGMEGGTMAHDGWCVLVDGEEGLRVAGRESRL